MPDSTLAPYIPHSPGDLITADDWNAVQVDVKQDIAGQISTAVTGITSVSHADDSDKLGNKLPDDFVNDIVAKVLDQLQKRTGYMQVFNLLPFTSPQVTPKIVNHKLGAFAVTDVYELDFFTVNCAAVGTTADAGGATQSQVLFYLYHEDDLRTRVPANSPRPINTDEDGVKYGVLWKSMLDLYNVQYTPDTSLDDLEVDWWRAVFAPPSDKFDATYYCHSAWFEKCCGEKRTVGDLTKAGDFDDIYLQIRPRKTINLTAATATLVNEPANVRVAQIDKDNIALTLEVKPTFPTQPQLPPDLQNYLPVMSLLKV